MCGRYVITSSPEAIRALFRLRDPANFPPRYNIAPTQPIPVVRLVDGAPRLELMRWGLIPAWVKDPRQFSLLVNARGESVNDKPAFKNAMRYRRCLVPADGFYEWKGDGERKRPFYAHAKAGPIAFAGLYEVWCGPNGEELDTVCIVTTAANHRLAPLHDRMPVVVAPEAFDMWLDCARVDAELATALIASAPEDLFEAYEVSTAVNRTANDAPYLIEPLKEGEEAATPPAPRATRARAKKDDGQQSLF